LVVHELATNATKYGALSAADGRISVSWKIDAGEPRTVVLTWREMNGPAVKRPRRRGFGTELIEREVSGTLGGDVTFEYAPDGLRARLAVPFTAHGTTLASAPGG
jgi:two-component sensor histidine kinase